MSDQIILPAGLEVIETWEISYLLTQARHPNVPRAGVSSAEILGKSDSDATAILEFSDSDRALLDRIWQGREDWRTGIPRHIFADYLAAFEDHPERPVWNFSWIASGGKHLADRVKFDTVVRRHIVDGTLPVRDKDTREVIHQENRMQDSHRTTVVSVEDFSVYAKLFLVDVRAGDPAVPVPEPDVFCRAENQSKQDEPIVENIDHGGNASLARLTECKRSAIIKSFSQKYPALRSALDRPEEWTKACRVPDRKSWYYSEKIEAECRARYGGSAPTAAVDMSAAAQLRAAVK